VSKVCQITRLAGERLLAGLSPTETCKNKYWLQVTVLVSVNDGLKQHEWNVFYETGCSGFGIAGCHARFKVLFS